MTVPAGPAPQVSDVDPVLAELVEEFTGRLQAGEALDAEGFAREHPDRADQLRRLLPALQALADLGNSALPPTATSLFPPTEAPVPALGDYRILEEIGRGGMGVVYRAEQISLGRQVALKVLPFAAALDPRQLQRFKNEAQAAAHLHHTNIVPVFSIDVERGIHYYAMQYIEGRTLATVIRELRQLHGIRDQVAHTQRPGTPPPAAPAPDGARTSTAEQANTVGASSLVGSGSSPFSPRSPFFHTVANLGAQAAEALEHAHSMGVVHRDIKPANLLVDVRGNLWVTDFGLAQFQQDVRLTMTGDVLGTLRYMSPEQALGQRGRVDHRTDIYALGVTLYELLTLQPAFPAEDRRTLMRQVAEDDPVPPRKLNRAIPVELETIVLKATSKLPEGRYGTAQEMADDLRRYLTDRPILARRPRLWEKVQKWARRHKAFVVACLLLLVTAVVALATVAWVAVSERRATEVARQEAVKQGAIAIAERADALAKLQLARKAVDDFYSQVGEKWLGDVPQLEETQREILLKALRFYEQFGEQPGTDTATRLEAAQAYRRVGSIYLKLGQPKPARQAFERGLALLQDLVTADPSSLEAERWLAHAHDQLGVILQQSGQFPEAQEHQRLAVERLERLASRDPDNPEVHNLLGGTLNNLAITVGHLGRLREKAELLGRAIAWQERAVARQPGRGLYRYFLRNHFQALAHTLVQLHRFEEADSAFSQSLALTQKLCAEHPSNAVYRYALASNYLDQGQYLQAASRPQQAEPAHRQARPLFEQLVRDFPRVPAYRNSQGRNLHHLATLVDRNGDPEEALRLIQQALACQHDVLKTDPHNRRARLDLHYAYQSLSDLQRGRGRLTEAKEAARQALAAAQVLYARNAEIPENRSILANSYDTLAQIARAQGEQAEAVRLLRQARPLLDKLAADFRSVPTYQDDFGHCLLDLGNLLLDNPATAAEAEDALRQAAAIYRRLDDANTKSRRYRANRVEAFGRWAEALQRTGRPAEAEQVLAEGVQFLREQTAAHPGSFVDRQLLGKALHRLADAARAGGNVRQARLLLEDALANQRQALRQRPDNADCRQQVRNHLQGLTGVCLDLGDYQAAAAFAHDLADIIPGSWEGPYEACGHLARCASVALADAALPAEERARRTDDYVGRGKRLLQEALARLPDTPVPKRRLAWLLATHPDPRFRDPPRAVELARRAVDLSPDDAEVLLTLGVARYRSGDWKSADAALGRADERFPRGDARVLLFRAMTAWQLGDRDTARQWHARAVQVFDDKTRDPRTGPSEAEWNAFRAEAAALLGPPAGTGAGFLW
jgi:eukaryotic-like serine/threonine-protein kinase